jgi:starch synthase
MKIIHVSTECYPAAKSGGLGDVVGSLPIYLNKIDADSSVIIPKYDRKWFKDHSFTSVYSNKIYLIQREVHFKILKLDEGLPYDFYCVDIPGLFDRESIYLAEDGEGYRDEPERNISFQRAVLHWLSSVPNEFDIIHCHDHQAGLIPFLMKHGYDFQKLRNKSTFFTIHNGQYRGIFPWTIRFFLGNFDLDFSGLLDWDDSIHSLASAIKCADWVNTVSPSYMNELQNIDDSLNWLFNNELSKSVGILNGIDTEDWDPEQDKNLSYNLKKSWDRFKSRNKEFIMESYGLDKDLPLISFIGRLTTQKGVDRLIVAINNVLAGGLPVQFFLLGSGDKWLEHQFELMRERFQGKVAVYIGYSEPTARQVYASSDYVVVPSRFEPCGLNQLFAMRYGSIPIVNNTGGLKDTVPDISVNGNGISFNLEEGNSVEFAFKRAVDLFEDEKEFKKLRKRIVKLDYSWEKSAKEYLLYYEKIIKP